MITYHLFSKTDEHILFFLRLVYPPSSAGELHSLVLRNKLFLATGLLACALQSSNIRQLITFLLLERLIFTVWWRRCLQMEVIIALQSKANQRTAVCSGLHLNLNRKFQKTQQGSSRDYNSMEHSDEAFTD